ncbi:MAG: D-alanyl-D-alanine carboxypeptidase/D-alanyl-D-alanine-endopeptidase [Candidatus Baltobacteraceae bacterium]
MHSFLSLLFAVILYGAPPSPAPKATPTMPPLPAPAGTAWTPRQMTALRGKIDAILKAPTLRGAQIGFYAIDTVRHATIYSRNADEEFMPASNFKLLVGSTAVQKLGTSFSYVTRVSADGPPAGGTIRGNVYLRGGGDALLRSGDLDAAAAALAAQGVRRIQGDVVTDATHFDSQAYGYGWSWDDLPYYYAPVVTALELEDGVAHVTMIPGAKVGDPIDLRVWPQSDAYTIDNQITTGPAGSKDTSDIVRPWENFSTTIRLTGSYPLGAKESGDIVPAVPDPQAYAGDVFLRALRAHGVTVSGAVRKGERPANAQELWTHRSEQLPQLLQDFWYPSDNLMGELLLKEVGAAQSGEPGTDEKGRAAETALLRAAGVDPATVTISDGSGLSQYDRITPRDFVAILQYDWNSPQRDVILNALPISGKRGTLGRAYLGTPAQDKVFAKTGSINHVRTLSGYVQTRTHGPVTFSLLFNQWMGEDAATGAADLAKVRAALLSQFAMQ